MRTDPRTLIAQAARTGKPLDLRRWGRDGGRLRAADLSESLVEKRAPHRRGLTILGAIFDEAVDLSDVRFDSPLRFHHCRFGSTLLADRSELKALELDHCSITRTGGDSLSLHEAHISTDVVISASTMEGPLRATAAKLGGSLTIWEGTRIGADADGDSLWLDAIAIGTDLVVAGSGTTTVGALRIYGGTVGGTVTVTDGAHLGCNRTGSALDADRVEVSNSVQVSGEGTRLDGALRLMSATVGSQLLVLDGVTVAPSSEGIGVEASHMRLGGDLIIGGNHTRLGGAINTGSAHVGGNLAIQANTHIGATPNGHSILAERAKISGELRIAGPGTRLDGSLVLTFAAIGASILALSGVSIGSDQSDLSITADAAQVAGALYLTGPSTWLYGALQVTGASIGGMAQVTNGLIVGSNGHGESILGDRLHIGQGLRVAGTGTRLHGSLRLRSAQVAGQLVIEGGSTIGTSDTGRSIDADNLVTNGGVYLVGQSTRLDGSVRMSWAKIGGQFNLGELTVGADQAGTSLDLSGLSLDGNLQVRGRAKLQGALHCSDGTINGQMAINGSRVGRSGHVGLHLSGSELDELIITGPHSEMAGSIVAQGTTVKRDVSMVTTRVGSGPSRKSIDLRRAKVAGEIRIQGSDLVGALDASDSVVRELRALDSSIGTDDNGWSLSVVGASMGRLIVGSGSRLSGGLHMARASLRGLLTVGSGASIGNVRGRPSIDGQFLKADGIVVRNGHLDGSIRVPKSELPVGLALENGSRINLGRHPARVGIRLTGSTMGEVRLLEADWQGVMDLTECHILRLIDSHSFWFDRARGDGKSWALSGMRVERVTHSADMPIEDRITWLGPSSQTSDPRRLGRPATTAGPQAADRATYRGVAKAFANAGLDEAATETLIAMRRRHNPRWLRRALWPVSQGYRLQRAAFGLLAVLVAILAVTLYAHSAGDLVGTGGLSPAETFDEQRNLIASSDCDASEYPCLRPLVFTLDTMVPGLDLGEADRWSLRTGRGWSERSSLLRVLLVSLRLIGWALGALFLLGCLSIVLEERRGGS